MRQQVDQRGIGILDHVMLQELLVRGRALLWGRRDTPQPWGAVHDPRWGDHSRDWGCGEVYAQTTNVTGITGDGMAMALRAGVDLVDMGIRAVLPVALRWPVTRLLASPTLFPLGARLYNARGERFMANLPQGTENVTRDIRSRAIFQEIVAGRGLHHDAVIMSLADIDEAAFRRYAPDMAHIGGCTAARLSHRSRSWYSSGGPLFLRWCAHRMPGATALAWSLCRG